MFHRIHAIELKIALCSNYEKSRMLRNLVKPGVINIASVKDIISIGFIKKVIHCIHILDRSWGNMHKGRNLGVNIEKGMKFYSSLVLSKPGPPENAKAKIDSRGIKSINLTIYLKIIVCPVLSGNINKMISILLEDFTIAVQIGFCKVAACDIFTKAKMILFATMSIYSYYQITQTIAVGKLTKNHTKQLIPTTKMLDILVPIIFFDKFVKYSLRKKLNDLSVNIFSLIHG